MSKSSKKDKATDDVAKVAAKAADTAASGKGKKDKQKSALVRPLHPRTVSAINKWKADVLQQFEAIDNSPLTKIEIDRFFYLLRKLKEIEHSCYDVPPPWFVERAWGTEMRTLFNSLREQVRHAQSRSQTRDVLWKQVGLLLVEEVKDPELLGRILTRLEQIHAGNLIESKEVASVAAPPADLEPAAAEEESQEALEAAMQEEEDAQVAAAEAEAQGQDDAESSS